VTAPRWRRELAAAWVEPADVAALVAGRRLCAADIAAATVALPARIPRAYADLIDPGDPADPIAAMVVPDPREQCQFDHLSHDPLLEDRDAPLPGLVHRYPDRVLLTVTGRCAAVCRFCMRRRLAGRALRGRDSVWLAEVVAYLRARPGVREVILSGGDPLVLSDRRLATILDSVRTVPHVELLRIDTRVPVVLPSRVTAALVDVLRAEKPTWVVTHFNHPRELTADAVAACARLADAGLPLQNQAVLLAGVNDDPATQAALCRALLRARVRPYYLHQCDLVAGTEHFRTPVSAGIDIVRHLCGRIAGLGIPRYVVDAPGGHGKVWLAPDNVVGRQGDHVLLRAPDGATVRYPDPAR
jgi:lysine 2,3-aminomutase